MTRRYIVTKVAASELRYYKISTQWNVAFFWQPYLLALVERSLEVLLMLALLSSRFLGAFFSNCWWVEDEELMLARESSSDIPICTDKNKKQHSGHRKTTNTPKIHPPNFSSTANIQCRLSITSAINTTFSLLLLGSNQRCVHRFTDNSIWVYRQTITPSLS